MPNPPGTQPRELSGAWATPPISPSRTTQVFSEALNAPLMWLKLTEAGSVSDVGRGLFSGSLADRNRLWREFRNCIRQAHAYWEAGQSTAGSSSALLYYYSFLNLAKAELLTTRPADVQGRVHHGLSFNPTAASSFRGDRIKVVQGVFPMLYEKRVGAPLTAGTTFSVPRMLSLIFEIGLEFEAAKLGAAQATPCYHSVAHNSDAAWVLIGTYSNGFLTNQSHVTTQLIRKHFDFFSNTQHYAYRSWREIFGLSVRLATDLMILQSKATFSSTNSDGTPTPDVQAATRHLREVADPYVNDSLDHTSDFVLTPSILNSRAFPLPAPIARYAVMFYLSSLVRYKPAALDPVTEGRAAWLFDSFARETPTRLLADFAAGILGSSFAFEPASYRI